MQLEGLSREFRAGESVMLAVEPGGRTWVIGEDDPEWIAHPANHADLLPLLSTRSMAIDRTSATAEARRPVGATSDDTFDYLVDNARLGDSTVVADDADAVADNADTASGDRSDSQDDLYDHGASSDESGVQPDASRLPALARAGVLAPGVSGQRAVAEAARSDIAAGGILAPLGSVTLAVVVAPENTLFVSEGPDQMGVELDGVFVPVVDAAEGGAALVSVLHDGSVETRTPDRTDPNGQWTVHRSGITIETARIDAVMAQVGAENTIDRRTIAAVATRPGGTTSRTISGTVLDIYESTERLYSWDEAVANLLTPGFLAQLLDITVDPAISTTGAIRVAVAARLELLTTAVNEGRLEPAGTLLEGIYEAYRSAPPGESLFDRLAAPGWSELQAAVLPDGLAHLADLRIDIYHQRLARSHDSGDDLYASRSHSPEPAIDDDARQPGQMTTRNGSGHHHIRIAGIDGLPHAAWLAASGSGSGAVEAATVRRRRDRTPSERFPSGGAPKRRRYAVSGSWASGAGDPDSDVEMSGAQDHRPYSST
ncbi:hypothetical protein [Jatrophihabitans sp. GAS493]|uniref:hypothetical protein n=1 Tax=Jatrophihabitans sp. GAS493 TaxID=1907575 RepID=UPI000BB8A369|nr:hypothetical protein [Jatrophihabitans sp. GAS493]